mmetsp:Transcript_116503/g.309935  ORF Transcript_116503/g.309935 Transcript_116503/m.309935 type:complete len:209 (-) Transcript_116503:702-1328(-)
MGRQEHRRGEGFLQHGRHRRLRRLPLLLRQGGAARLDRPDGGGPSLRGAAARRHPDLRHGLPELLLRHGPDAPLPPAPPRGDPGAALHPHRRDHRDVGGPDGPKPPRRVRRLHPLRHRHAPDHGPGRPPLGPDEPQARVRGQREGQHAPGQHAAPRGACRDEVWGLEPRLRVRGHDVPLRGHCRLHPLLRGAHGRAGREPSDAALCRV